MEIKVFLIRKAGQARSSTCLFSLVTCES